VGLSGFPLPFTLAISSGAFGILSSTTVPLFTCANRVHPLVRFAPLQSTTVAGLPKIRKPQAPSLGLAIPHRDINHPRLVPRASLICSVPCRPRRFARPRRFTPRLALWVYFTPLPRPGLTLQGFDSSSAAALPFGNRCPLVVRSSSATAVAHRSTSPVRALRALLHVRVRRTNNRGLAVYQFRSPLELVLLQVFSLPALAMLSHRVPLVTFPKRLS